MKRTALLLSLFMGVATPTLAEDKTETNMSTPSTTPNMSVPAEKPKLPNACYPHKKKPEPLIG